MSLEANKNVVRRYFRALEQGHIDEAIGLVADDAQWWVQGTGMVPRDALRGIWSQLFSPANDPKAMKIVGMVAEGDSVATEVESDVKLPDGRDFRNTFHILFVIENGKFVRVREYFDTAYTQKFMSGQ